MLSSVTNDVNAHCLSLADTAMGGKGRSRLPMTMILMKITRIMRKQENVGKCTESAQIIFLLLQNTLKSNKTPSNKPDYHHLEYGEL